ncbi:hypothetical protein F0365_12175 [Nonlabens sp. Ci31]|jgi:hypothetical protein|uniref:hypothetical protein n=1 Tax=Nonlabens sp. Ci31 TaxID=2608253 RepID=UPI0014649512|nr:hypothetical protein [Nonlabens sp. Ci31]QJP35092.1 hypothetical protein F0365_12175 [Nonlabens sp. Ci31]
MNKDLFTKGILAVIAWNLSFLSVDKILDNFTSQDTTELTKRFVAVPLNNDGSINVRVTNNETIKVDISNISTNDELDINIDEVGGAYVPYGKLKVVIEN